MKCINPADAFLAQGKVYFSKRTISGVPRHSIKIACGHCWQCRRENALDTAVRAEHESHYWSHSFFLTLTYAPEHLPPHGSLNRDHTTVFCREIKRKYNSKESTNIMLFGCGEYGGKFGRPHYHFIVFSNFQITHDDFKSFWSYGSVDVGNVESASIAYVCKYSVKKVLGNNAKEYYESRGIIPEYGIFPKAPAMGRKWIEDNLQFIRSNNFVYYGNGKRRIPRYYKRILAELDPEAAASKSNQAQEYMIESEADSSLTRFARTFNYLKRGDSNSLRSDNLDSFLLSYFNYSICGN